MNGHLLAEILTAYTDHLLANDRHREGLFLKLLPDQRGELASLTLVVRQLKAALTPVAPLDAFREDLHNSLLAAAYQQQAQGTIEQRGLAGPRRLSLKGIASAVSLALGVITFIALARARASQA